MAELLEVRRRRLMEQPRESLEPFARADNLKDCSLYWCGVRGFPMSAYERAWLLEFLLRLARRMKQTAGLREETFLQSKATLPDLMQLFTSRAMDYAPATGMTLIPGTKPVGAPDPDELRDAAAEAGKSGKPVDPTKWMPDHAHWFLKKDAAAERDDFFGYGGMFSLLLPPSSDAAVSLPRLPRLFTTHPAFTGDMQKNLEMGSSLRDPFLKRSKEIFGEPFKDQASYPGLLFVLPLLTASAVLESTPEQRQSWFELFDMYWGESKRDGGLLLLTRDPHFDVHLLELLESMRADGLNFRSAR